MKLKTIRRNYESVKAKTGIDFEQYQEESWGETVADLIFFPQYAFFSIIKGPLVLVGLVIVIAGLSYYFGHTAFALFFGLIGLVLGLVNGVFLGCIWFVRSLTDDLNRLVGLTVQKSNSVIQSFNDPTQRAAYTADAMDVVRGVVFSMVLPEVNRVVAKKVPVIGGLVAYVMGLAVSKMTDGIENRLNQTGPKEGNAQAALPPTEQQMARLTSIQNTSDRIADGTASVASFPFKVVLGIVGTLSLGVVALLYWMLF